MFVVLHACVMLQLLEGLRQMKLLTAGSAERACQSPVFVLNRIRSFIRAAWSCARPSWTSHHMLPGGKGEGPLQAGALTHDEVLSWWYRLMVWRQDVTVY